MWRAVSEPSSDLAKQPSLGRSWVADDFRADPVQPNMDWSLGLGRLARCTKHPRVDGTSEPMGHDVANGVGSIRLIGHSSVDLTSHPRSAKPAGNFVTYINPI